MKEVKIKRTFDARDADVSSDLYVPIGDRDIWYEVYVDGVFFKAFLDDVMLALEYKEALLKAQ